MAVFLQYVQQDMHIMADAATDLTLQLSCRLQQRSSVTVWVPNGSETLEN